MYDDIMWCKTVPDGMKVHSGVDMSNTITRTAANVYDIDTTAKLIRKEDEVAYGDSGYSGAEKREEIAMMIIASQPRIKKVLCQDILEMFREDDEYRKQFEEENDVAVLDDSLQLHRRHMQRSFSGIIHLRCFRRISGH